MNINASLIANAFIDVANKDGRDITLLGLIKRVYIAHGLSLAILNKGLLDKRFDKVEAWKYGPVIPSIYHSFKHFGSNPITEKVGIFNWNTFLYEEIPCLTASSELEVVQAVWRNYKDFSDNDLVTLLHEKGTPWDYCYKKGENVEIPDYVTKTYYELLLKENGY